MSKILKLKYKPVYTKWLTEVSLLRQNIHLGHAMRESKSLRVLFYFKGVRFNYVIADVYYSLRFLKVFLKFLIKTLYKYALFCFAVTRDVLAKFMKRFALGVGECFVINTWVKGFLKNFKTALKAKKMANNTNLAKRLPNIIFFTDSKKNISILHEANKLKIPVFNILDSNYNWNNYLYYSTGNDEAYSILIFYVQVIGNTILKAKTIKYFKLYNDCFLISSFKKNKFNEFFFFRFSNYKFYLQFYFFLWVLKCEFKKIFYRRPVKEKEIIIRKMFYNVFFFKNLRVLEDVFTLRALVEYVFSNRRFVKHKWKKKSYSVIKFLKLFKKKKLI